MVMNKSIVDVCWRDARQLFAIVFQSNSALMNQWTIVGIL